MERIIDVYYLPNKNVFVPWTLGFSLCEQIKVVEKSDLPARVKRMRIRLLREQLIAYYEATRGVKYGGSK